MSRLTTPGQRLFRSAIGLLAALALAPPLRAQSAGVVDSTGSIVGIVTIRDGGISLPYSVASAPSLGKERFSNDSGVFVLRDLPPGSLAIRVRHVGYTPADLIVTVHPGKTDT